MDWYHHIVLTLSFKLVSFFYIYTVSQPHRLNGSSSHVLTATSRSYGKAKNSTSTESKRLIWLRSNLAQLITSARRPPVQNFMQIRPWGASRQMGEIYAEIFIYDIGLPFFQKLTYRSDPWVDSSARWLKRRGLTQGCAFWGLKKFGINIWPLKNPPKVEILPKNGLKIFGKNSSV